MRNCSKEEEIDAFKAAVNNKPKQLVRDEQGAYCFDIHSTQIARVYAGKDENEMDTQILVYAAAKQEWKAKKHGWRQSMQVKNGMKKTYAWHLEFYEAHLRPAEASRVV